MRGLCRLILLRLLAKRLLHLAEVGRCKHIGRVRRALVLILQLAVDGNHILDQQDHHHQKLKYQANHNGTDNHGQQTIAAHPMPVRCHKEHKHALNHRHGGEEDVERLQNLLHNQIAEIEKIVQRLAEGVQLAALFVRRDEDKRQHRGSHSKQKNRNRRAAEVVKQIAEVHEIHIV